MPAGILQPGGPGTEIFVYDHAASASGLYYTFAEINAAFPNDFELMGGLVSGLQWGGIRKQYTTGVRVTMGGQAADGTAPTYLQDSNCDVYFRSQSLNYRTVGYSPALLRTTFGTRVATEYGTFKSVSGRDGVDIMTRATQSYRGQQFMYGSETFVDGGSVQFLDSGAAGYSEIAGCTMRCSGAFVVGNSPISPQMDVYNSTFTGSTTGTLVSAMAVRDSDNMVLAATSPASFVVSASFTLNFRGGVLAGTPTVSDFRWTGGGANWSLFNPQFSETVGVPRFIGTLGPTVADPTEEFWYFNTKVGDIGGNPIIDVPIFLASDVDGALLDTKTFGDGDVGFVDNGTGINNGIRVRDHYQAGGVYTVRDRTYTLTVNGYGGTYPPLQGYETLRMTFQWPGRDVFRGAFEENGGEFKMVIMPIMLKAGRPSNAALWTECEV